MKSNREKLAWAFAIVIAAGLLFPVTLGEPRAVQGSSGGDSWRNLIYDFQTLITGLAAVFAAAVTIRTMERTDRESERRHRELVMIQMRPERLKVSRALFPQIQDLRDIVSQFHDFDKVGSELPPPCRGTPEWYWLTEVSKRYLPCFDRIQSVLLRRQFQEGIVLFDGTTTRIFDELLEQTDLVRTILRDHARFDAYFDPNKGEHQNYEERFAAVYDRAFSAITLTLGLLPRFIESLEFTRRSYGV
ncbi:hypothetical protein EFR00_25040 [Rhizobium sophoriradicis]|uniref:hypothetical protein n=1 Tax=Rhizobium TaxID=379 RepID=UPI00098F1F8D|nr:MULTISPECIES: hypothetical protein [Rhizobium]RSB91793.1 hypothetical protein EFR00_25040 [Rhizobium sophoriradicis]